MYEHVEHRKEVGIKGQSEDSVGEFMPLTGEFTLKRRTTSLHKKLGR